MCASYISRWITSISGLFDPFAAAAANALSWPGLVASFSCSFVGRRSELFDFGHTSGLSSSSTALSNVTNANSFGAAEKKYLIAFSGSLTSHNIQRPHHSDLDFLLVTAFLAW